MSVLIKMNMPALKNDYIRVCACASARAHADTFEMKIQFRN